MWAKSTGSLVDLAAAGRRRPIEIVVQPTGTRPCNVCVNWIAGCNIHLCNERVDVTVLASAYHVLDLSVTVVETVCYNEVDWRANSKILVQVSAEKSTCQQCVKFQQRSK